MGARLIRLALRHNGIVTTVAVAGLLLNLVVIGSADPPGDLVERDLPMAAQCQGGGAGCAEQPLIPPPALGLPHIDQPTVAFGGLVLVDGPQYPPLTPSPPRLTAPPPLLGSIA